MLKKLLATSLACIMVLSSMAVVSFADTAAEPTVIQEWVEDFDDYIASQFDTTDANTLYKDQNQTCHKKMHLHLNDDWIIWDAGNYSSTGHVFTKKYYNVEDSGKGKLNGEKCLVSNDGGVINNKSYISNSFGGSSVDLSTGNVLGFTFDWFSNATQDHTNHQTLLPQIEIIADLTDGTTTYNNIPMLVAAIDGYRIRKASTNSNDLGVVTSNESWNTFTTLISKDSIKLNFNAYSDDVSFGVDEYVPSTGAYYSSSYDSGFEISKIHTIRLTNSKRNRQNYKHGFDNLKLSLYSSMPSSIEDTVYANFMDFTAAYDTDTQSKNEEGDGKRILLPSDTEANQWFKYQISETSLSGNNTKVEIMKDDSATKLSLSSYPCDGFLKVSNTEGTYISGSPLVYLKHGTSSLVKPQNGDKVQYSYDIKVAGNADASNTSRFIELSANLDSGDGEVVYVSANGTVYDPAKPSVSTAKLKADTWYSFDTVYELTAIGTIARVYLDGKFLYEKTLTEEVEDTSSIYWSFRLTYRNVANAEKTAYLPNSVCLDNLCYQIFKGGANAYNFDKSASTANNIAIANADVDFAAGTIFPVAEDFTVADFNRLGLTNATVLEADKTTEVTDTTVALAGKVIKFTGDYGKDVYFTVSSEGGANVTKTSFVTLRENLGTTFAESATAGKLLTAKAVKDNENLEVYIAEYKDGELVGLTIGDGVANYTPKAAGNQIKVFIWAEGELVPAFSGAASTLNVN